MVSSSILRLYGDINRGKKNLGQISEELKSVIQELDRVAQSDDTRGKSREYTEYSLGVNLDFFKILGDFSESIRIFGDIRNELYSRTGIKESLPSLYKKIRAGFLEFDEYEDVADED